MIDFHQTYKDIETGELVTFRRVGPGMYCSSKDGKAITVIALNKRYKWVSEKDIPKRLGHWETNINGFRVWHSKKKLK